MDIMEIRWECMDWIHLVRDKDHYWTVVNMIINHQVL
jgi:hypothetical protein